MVKCRPCGAEIEVSGLIDVSISSDGLEDMFGQKIAE